MRSALVALVVAVPSLAAANPVTVGVALGATESKSDAAAGADANDTYGLFGRFALNGYVSGQLEIEKLQTESSTTIRRATGLVVLDLMQDSIVVPVLFAGIGLDRAASDWDSSYAHHFEGGLGVELRTSGGFTLGLDVRIGGRSIDGQSSKAVPVGIAGDDAAPPLPPASDLSEGEYRSARLSLGVRF